MSLVDRLRHANPKVREVALVNLSCKTEPTDQEFLALADLLQDDSPLIRELAAQTLEHGAVVRWRPEQIISAIPGDRLLPALGDGSSAMRQIVLRVLRPYPVDGRIRAAAMRLLDDPVCVVRICAAAVVWAQTQDQSAIRPVVDAAIRSGDRWAVRYGCGLVMEFGPAAGDVAPLVWDYLRDPDAALRLNAGYAVLKCCLDKQVLAAAAALLESTLRSGADDEAIIRFTIRKLRRAAES
ncbi:MAG: hypothetical protein U0736_00260 [Gemmataceae bacterium]